jgi:hypothetical protein
VPILLLTLFPKLARLFSFCKCPPFLCFYLILFLLFIGVGFGFNLAPFWGCLNIVSCALVHSTRFFKSFKTRLGKLFVYPLIKLLKTQWMN